MKKSKLLDIITDTVNFIIIGYALLSVGSVFKPSPISILFFASNIWLLSRHYENLYKLTGSKRIAAVIDVLSVLLLLLTACFIGFIDGKVVRFY